MVNPTSQQELALARTRRVELIIILGALTAFAALSIDMYLPALPSIARDFRVPIGAAERTLSAFFLGFAFGQAFFGPLADRFGRKPPLYAGLAFYVLMCVACASTQSADMLMVARFFQAIGACAGGVIARACVRDLFGPEEAPRIFAYMMLVLGVAPLIAPFLGGYLLIWASWRAIFWTQAATGGIAAIAIMLRLPETHGGAHRTLHPLKILRDYWIIAQDRRFIAYAMAGAISNASMFAYITGSPHVFIDLFHVHAENFGWFFSAIAAGLITMAQISARLLKHASAERVMLTAQTSQALAGVLLVIIAYLSLGGMIGLALALFVFVALNGAIMPMATGVSMRHYGLNAGMASALIGALQFGAATISSLVMGAFSPHSAVPMTAIMAGCAIAGLALHIAVRPR
ncbi:MAG TPA: Bcr/CflA family multidrug efflux MFS transporter [Rhizomicrobium sp.]|nr:Bcr/CflA family multidrug efflux MFS transporter [Rhizomicrobium sp.]